MRLLLSFLVLAATAVSSGCNEEPLFPPRPLQQGDARLFSAARAENIGRAATFDFLRLASFPVELPGTAGEWDVLLTEQNGSLVFVPSSAISEFQATGARLAVVESRNLAEVERAPADTAAFTAAPRPVRTGVVYVVRTRRADCTRFAKFEVTEVTPASGAVRIAFVQNPNCEDRDLDIETT